MLIQNQTLTLRQLSPLILKLTLSNVKRHNAMNKAFFLNLAAAMKLIELHQTARVLVFDADGKNFTVGLDLNQAASIVSFDAPDPARNSLRLYKLIRQWQNSFTLIAKCKIPVIAVIHGACIGGGIDLLGCFDMAFCTKNSNFSIKQIDIGIAADLGTLQRIPRLTANHSRIFQLIVTGDHFDGSQAVQLGLISKAFQSKQQMQQYVQKLSRKISQRSPIAIYTIKRVIRKAKQYRLEEQLKDMARINSLMLQASDMSEAVRAKMSKQPGNFTKL